MKKIVLFVFTVLLLSSCAMKDGFLIAQLNYENMQLKTQIANDKEALFEEINQKSEQIRQANLFIEPYQGVYKDGSGVLIKKDGNSYYILTNRNVLYSDFREYVVFISQGEDNFLGMSDENIIGETTLDLGIIDLYSEATLQIPLVEIDPSLTVTEGDFLLVVENTETVQGVVTLTKSLGNISREGVDFEVIHYQYSMNTKGHNSGMVYNLEGQLVGIQYDSDNGIDHYAIPIAMVSAFINEYLK